ncbi:MAG: hypothetical protein IJU27_00275 [Bacteroidales bacterium]|nr:hypothetical protein [Bacteroidales bacterium]
MYQAVMEYGMLPLCSNHLPGFSIEEMTPREYWFFEDELGPWDWKIDLVQSGDIAYGKFLLGGKASFATVECYRQLMQYRRSLPKYQPSEGPQQQAMEFIRSHGSASVRELRSLLGMKKGQVDALLTHLQMDTLVVTGDITRVYRGADLHYNGWQNSSFCTPDDLFDNTDDFPFLRRLPRDRAGAASGDGAGAGGFAGGSSEAAAGGAAFGPGGAFGDGAGAGAASGGAAFGEGAGAASGGGAEAYAALSRTILSHFPGATPRDIARILGYPPTPRLSLRKMQNR